MKKKQSSRTNATFGQEPSHFSANDSSINALNYGRPQYMMDSPQKSQQELSE